VKDIVINCPYAGKRMPERVEAGTDMWIRRTSVNIGNERIKETLKRSPADDFADYGFNLVPANTDRVNGWRRCNQYLSYEIKDGILTKKPQFYYFKDENPQFEICIPAMIHGKTNVEDMQKQDGDDVADEWRYAMMGIQKGSYGDVLDLYQPSGEKIYEAIY
jgi:hypothetical protein